MHSISQPCHRPSRHTHHISVQHTRLRRSSCLLRAPPVLELIVVVRFKLICQVRQAVLASHRVFTLTLTSRGAGCSACSATSDAPCSSAARLSAAASGPGAAAPCEDATRRVRAPENASSATNG